MLKKTISKADEARLQKLRPVAARFEKNAYRAATWFKNNGTPMYLPGALTETMKASKSAKAEIQTILAKYR